MRIALLAVVVATVPLAGQPKQNQMWADLKLGMTLAETRKALPYKSNGPKKREKVPGRSVPGVMRLQVPKGLLGNLPVTAALYFGEQDGLSGLLLISNHESPNYCGMADNLEKQAATLLWQSFLSELQKQNGPPSSSRTAEGEGGEVTSRVANWNGASGSPDITLLLMGSCKKIDVMVTYAPAGFRKQ